MAPSRRRSRYPFLPRPKQPLLSFRFQKLCLYLRCASLLPPPYQRELLGSITRTPLADLHAYGRFLCKTGLTLLTSIVPHLTSRVTAAGHLDEGCVCFVRALAQALGSSSGELDEAEVDAIREDAWLTASKIVPLSYSFFVQSSAFAQAERARLCLARSAEAEKEQNRSFLDWGGGGGGSVWSAVACECGFRSDTTPKSEPNQPVSNAISAEFALWNHRFCCAHAQHLHCLIQVT